MKFYERFETGQVFMPMMPILARVDGRAFHTFCKGLNRPYDERLIGLMTDVTRFLVEQTNATVGYTQSDEITLAWSNQEAKSEMFFGGKKFKVISIVSSLTTLMFNHLLEEWLPEKADKLPIFDCRVWQVPNLDEACNVFVWREQDAVRNSLQMAAQSIYSHNELHNKNAANLHDMLMEKGINWNDYPSRFKRGTYIRRTEKTSVIHPAELANLPEKHNARINPDMKFTRNVIEEIDLKPLSKFEDKVSILFS